MSGIGNLFVVVAPSGAGKTTLVGKLLELDPHIRLSISFTTRVPRDGEANGRDYHFVDRPTFEKMIAAGDFLEWADVFGNLYGTCASDTERLLADGSDVVLVIDVQGARQVRGLRPGATTVFVMPPSYAILEQRLRGRSKDSEGAILKRLQVARDEVASFTEYDFIVINDELTSAVDRLRGIVLAGRCQLSCMRTEAARVVATFA